MSGDLKCPRCDSDDSFDIRVEVLARFCHHPMVLDEYLGNWKFRNDSPCRCVECGFFGEVGDFVERME